MSARLVQQELASNYIGASKHVTFLHYGEEGARPKIYIQAALHAGEMTGTLALHHLRGLLDREVEAGTIRGEIILAPLANPIGLGQFSAGDQMGRFETQSLVNFNREHLDISPDVAGLVAGVLGDNSGENIRLIRAAALSVLGEIPETSEWLSLRKHLLLRAIDADVCLDLHSDMEATMFMYINAFDWPALEDLGRDIGCRAIVSLDPYVPSRTFAGVVGGLWPRLAAAWPAASIPHACQTAMIEMRGRHDCDHAQGSLDALNLLNFLRRRGVLSGDAPPLPPSQCDCVDVEGMDVGYAPAPGFTVFHRKAGEEVTPGDHICDVIDPTAADFTLSRMPIYARQTGTIYARALDGIVVTPGKVLFRIAGGTRLPHRLGRSWLDD